MGKGEVKLEAEARAVIDDVLIERVSDLFGSKMKIAATVDRGYTLARRVIVAESNGTRHFVKVGTDDHTRRMVSAEGRFYSNVQTSWTPELVAFDDEWEHPMIVVEDLSAARWPPPWRADDIAAVEETLRRVAEHPPPAGLERLCDSDWVSSGWAAVAAAPGEFLGLGLVTSDWLERSLPTLLAMSDAECFAGDALLHHDVRSDNIALLGGRVVLVDWSMPRIGSREADLYSWAPSLTNEGFRPTADLNDGRCWALLSGYWAARAGAPPPPSAVPHIRSVQRAQLIPALRYAITTLGLEPQAPLGLE